MDTRHKIRTAGEIRDLLRNGVWCVVASRFEFLTSDIAGLLKQTADGRRLLAVVLERGESVIPVEHRASLIAALRCVDAVTIAAEDCWRNLLPESQSIAVICDEAGDERRRREFRERIEG